MQFHKKFIARQPILDARQRTYAFELLFRSGTEDCFQSQDPDRASSLVVADGFFLFGMQTLTGGKIAFINFTRKTLIDRCPTLLPASHLVIEILESVPAEADVISACKAMKALGYRFALDDFVQRPSNRKLIEIADFIKVDFLATEVEERSRLARTFSDNGMVLVAEKVETRDQYLEALDMGYQYFQGFFFSRPVTIVRHDLPAFKVNYMRLLSAIHRPDPDIGQIEDVLKSEPSLCFKLLRYLNSALFGLSQEIHSIRHALSLLGLKEIGRWVSLVALAGLCADKPPALIMNSVIRAKLCELLAHPSGCADRLSDLFLAGLFSLIDSILDRPMEEILSNIPLANDVKEALLRGSINPIGELLGLAAAWERGDWERIEQASRSLRLDETLLADLHLQAVEWCNRLVSVDQLALAS